MAVSTSQLKIGATRKSIVDKLTQQSAGLQDTPWYQTAGKIALPILATMALPGIGTALASAYAGTGGIMGAIGGIGGALASTGGGLGIGATTKGLTTKAIANYLTTKGTKGALDMFDKRSEQDINLKGMGALAQALGGESVSKLRRDYRASKKESGDMDIAGSIMSAYVQQGGFDALKKAAEVGFPSSPAPASIKMGIPSASGVSSKLGGQQSISEMMGGQNSPLAQLGSGKIPLKDAISEATPSASFGSSDLYKGTTAGSSIRSSILPKTASSPIVNQMMDKNALEGFVGQQESIMNRLGQLSRVGSPSPQNISPLMDPEMQGMPGSFGNLGGQGQSWVDELFSSFKSGASYKAPSTPYYSGPGGQ